MFLGEVGNSFLQLTQINLQRGQCGELHRRLDSCFVPMLKKKSIYCIDVKNLYLSDTEKTGDGGDKWMRKCSGDSSVVTQASS